MVLTLLAWARLFVSGYTSTSRTISWVPRHLFESSLSFLVPVRIVNSSIEVAGMDHTKLSDSELIKRLGQDDRSVFAHVYRQYSSNIYKYIDARVDTSNDCDEILIDVFVSLWLDRHNLSHDLKSHLRILCRTRLAIYACDKSKFNFI